MKRDYFVSVAMATYNGEKYIKEQLDSILSQLNVDDELIISDDGSTDNTLNIIEAYHDRRIKIYNGPRKGVKQNFANAISHCNGKYIFLSDQDDTWTENKIVIMLEAFENNEQVKVVVHDNVIVDENMNIIEESFYKLRNSKPGIIKNIIKNSYIGCCMAFDASLKEKILPIPNNIEMHDQWIGIICEKYGKSVFIKDRLINYCRHGDNVSSLNHYPLSKMLKNRFIFIKELLKK